ncbi:MAG TPA: 4-(cytidine 5'-diphospho)-2-C-methyl-D-erythritol kinase, partial [Candidatus Sulfotelmatobacter sp.]
SSNAVAALLGLERAVKKSLPAEERLRIAVEVGSDLPLFLVGGTVLGVGRGEQVYPLQDLPATACVVVTPEVGVSTPKAFAEWDRMGGEGLGGAGTSFGRLRTGLAREAVAPVPAAEISREQTPAELRSAGQPRAAVPTQDLNRPVAKLTGPSGFDRMNLLGRGLSAWLSGQYSGAPSDWKRGGRAENPLLWLVRAGIENDFEQVVFPEYPELSEGKLALVRAGAEYASLSGSGSALYGMFASRAEAGSAAARLRKWGWAAQATATLTRRAYWRRLVAG